MNDLLTALDEIIKQEFKYASENGGYQLRELKIPNYPVTTINIDGKTACYTFDVDKYNIFPFFQDKAGLKKTCDYILFYIHENRVFIFLCELKSKQQDVEKAAMKQLKAAKIFIEYLVKTAERYKCQKYPVTYRALIFSLSNTPRFPTNIKNDFKTDSYKKGQALWFKHLRAGQNYYLKNHCHP